MTVFVIQSKFTGKMNKMDLPGPAGRIRDWLNTDPLKRPYVQHAFPDFTPDQREFLLTGATPKEWLEIFPPEDENDIELLPLPEGKDHAF